MARYDRGVFKEFPLSSFAVDHPTSVLVLTAIVIFMGVWSYIQVPKESFPEIVFPNVVVNTVYPGVAPKDVETLVTRPLEDELNTIGDIETIRSTSVEGFSSITAEFDAGMDVTEALQQVREKVDIAKVELPAAAEEPAIFEINAADFPVMQVNVAGPYGLVRLREVAEDLQDELEQITSVLEVRLSGGLEREVQVDVDLPKLKFYGLAFGDVIDVIRNENVTIPGGTIDVGGVKYLVRIPGEFTSPDLIGDIVIESRNGRAIYVRDVATVDFGFKERESFARLNGNPVVSLSIVKRSGENIIETAEAVAAAIEEQRAAFPPGTEVNITSNQAEQIREMVGSLENNIISGLLLVVGVLLFFLGVRTASFVGTAIPLSMLLSFSVIRFVGFSMNMVVLFSLILALGMLVDNAIVVVENIYRFREHEYDRKTAAKIGTGEVAMPIIASTATTLAAFFPMVFWPGIVGEFMKYLPLTLIMTLTSSLFVALIIVPTLCSLFLETEDAPPVSLPKPTKMALGGAALFIFVFGMLANPIPTILLALTVAILGAGYPLFLHPVGHWFMNQGVPALLRYYERFLRWALGHRWRIVVGMVGALVLSLMAFGRFNAGIEYFPEDIPPQSLYVQVEAPVGTRIEETDAMVQTIERELAAVPGRVDFESVLSILGSQITGNVSGGGQGGSHLASVAINFLDFQDREFDAFQVLEDLRSTVGTNIAGADISVEKPAEGPSTGAPVNLEIAGDDPDRLKELGDEAVEMLENSRVFAKLDGLESDLADGRPELVVEVDRERAALYGLNTMDIGFTIRSAINGTEASKYREGKDEYDITVRLAEAYRGDLNNLGDLNVVAEGGRQVPLSSVASWHVGTAFSDVTRKDLDRVVTVSSDVRADYNANAVLQEVRETLSGFEMRLPPGYHMEFTGQQQDQAESQAFLLGVFAMAVVLMAFILVSQFDSVFKPFIILTSVVFSTIGVLIGLIVFRMPFGVIMTGVGVISLAGVVVNNAIVLIDYIGILRERDKMTVGDALVRAGLTRFRPVILTAITTVLGLVPLAIGLNFDFIGLYTRISPELYWGGDQAAWWGPMAIAVIAGLTFATFLTLILVPVMYSLFNDFEAVLVRTFTRQGREEGAKEVQTDEPDGLAEPGVSGEPIPV
jgi:multidrug efflux pump subunit AcrB